MDAEKKEVVEKHIHEEGKREYASKGVAGTALGLGIAGTALALWGRNGLGSILGGGNTPDNVNINTFTGGGNGTTAPTAFQTWEKECEDHVALVNELWRLQLGTERQMYAHREKDVEEKFGLYKSQIEGDFGIYKTMVEGDFGLYKSQRDLYDVLNERYGAKFAELDKKVAVMEATRPYQDKLIQCEIKEAYMAGINYTDRKTCRMITGQLVLPSTPVVSGYGSYSACTPTASTPAVGG